jgi:phosphopentomutase
MSRALLLILDSVGIGGAPDAAAFGDAGSDTIGHIAEACAAGRANRAGLRHGSVRLPNLVALGLGEACRGATGRVPPGLDGTPHAGRYGHAREASVGKDTPSGHWELAGVPVTRAWDVFPHAVPCFPGWLIDGMIREGGLPGLLGLKHASGTEIIAELGEASVASGRPIAYTSADSVVQIAAHETAFGLERLFGLCGVTRRLLAPLNVGRVIARPFVGTSAADFVRTGNRRDYALPPPADTLLDAAKAAGRAVLAIGKIDDIFAHRGTTEVLKASGNAALIDATIAALARAPDGAIIVANLIDFDQLYGHRRDVAGYAAALEAFDARWPDISAALRPGDLSIVTADHGCDPTAPGTDHTREQVPVLAFAPGLPTGPLGALAFADVGASLAAHLGLDWRGAGRSFL